MATVRRKKKVKEKKSPKDYKHWVELPKNVKVSYSNFAISDCSETIARKEEMMAECCVETSKIRVFPVTSKHEMCNTVLHEILHAICWTQGLSSTLSSATEEKVVIAMANGLTLLMRDNPELMKWFKKNLK